MKKTLITLTLAAAGLVALAAPVAAHTPRVSHSCTAAGATLTVHLVQYEKGSTVTVSGQVQASGSKVEFGTAEYKATFNLGDGTSAKTWKVEIDNRGDGMNKADKFDSTFTDVVAQCVLTDLDLTPQPTIPAVTVPPQVEYIHPATPPCVLDGRFDANTPECEAAGTPVVVLNPPEVLERQPQPPVLAFTGSTATTRAIQGAAIFAIGLSLLYIGRRWTA